LKRITDLVTDESDVEPPGTKRIRRMPSRMQELESGSDEGESEGTTPINSPDEIQYPEFPADYLSGIDLNHTDHDTNSDHALDQTTSSNPHVPVSVSPGGNSFGINLQSIGTAVPQSTSSSIESNQNSKQVSIIHLIYTS